MKYKLLMEKYAIQEWKDFYIDYGSLKDSLSDLVTKVHKEIHTMGQSRTLYYELLQNNHLHRREEVGQEAVDNMEVKYNIDPIMVNEIPECITLLKNLTSELSKARIFYGVQVANMKLEFLHFIEVFIQLRLIRHFRILDEEDEGVSPGSTIALLLRKYHLSNDMYSSHTTGLDYDLNRHHELSNSSVRSEPLLFHATNSKSHFRGNMRDVISSWLLEPMTEHDIAIDWAAGGTSPSSDPSCAPASDPSWADDVITTPGTTYLKHNNSSGGAQMEVQVLEMLDSADMDVLMQGLKKDIADFYYQVQLVHRFGTQNELSLSKFFKKHRKLVGGRVESCPAIRKILNHSGFWGGTQHSITQLIAVRELSCEAIFLRQPYT
mmetsp:Transcript_36227/g.49028  ORF Transcript_36227/g.49028 Transcript_36227/m.49028 type:complete len:378 (-) Transcript_36227:193-1326(-)|eukprot:CAMPEP_0185744202 /NCGR_PEP_ID=MMETSP1174-20130828/2252_1 /TAXON_ID=35687 /ORGANISM="Dictyocha speculum, Strain CCMP1381" /LENGTH=377 /DNA_ID=CAMNT_0028417453 /DNA_START=195 /DNA_END=1328 /DNA_ORIENTATION=-